MQEFTSIEYIEIALANHYGKDKETYADRIKWAQEECHYANVIEGNADEPVLYAKAYRAYKDAQEGNPIGLPVAFDSVCSGVQIMSAIMRCETGAKNTGLINTGERPDLYTAITQNINEHLPMEVSRKEAKEATMTACYNSKAVPKRIFGKNVEVFNQALLEEAPGALRCMNIINNTQDKNATSYSWTLPDNHHVYCPVLVSDKQGIHIPELNHDMNTIVTVQGTKERDNSLPANVVHSIDGYILRSLVRFCNYNKPLIEKLRHDLDRLIMEREQVNNIEYVDITNLKGDLRKHSTEVLLGLYLDCEDMLKHKPFPVITVHDSFAAHPNNMNVLRRNYNKIMSRLSASNIMEDIVSELYQEDCELINTNPSIEYDILDGDYAIC